MKKGAITLLSEKITVADILAIRPQLKAFIFDLDGTLVDSQEGIITTVVDFLKSKGHIFTRDRISNLFGTPLEKVFKILIPRLTEEQIMEYLTAFREIYARKHTEITPIFPQTKPILKDLKSKGFKIGVASTKFKKFVVEILDHFELLDFFDIIISGYEVAQHKPAPDILIKTAELLDLSPQECIYIGDAPTDVEAGKRAGTATIAVLTGPYESKHFENERAKPDFIIRNLSHFILD